MKHSMFIVFLAIILVSCGRTMPVSGQLSNAQHERTQHYLETAEHLTEDQRQAIKHGKPFIGMTYEEASMAMTLVDWQGKFDGEILKAQFANGAGQQYVLFFDCDTPNRVTQWSAFTDDELEELTSFRDVQPCPPIALPFQR